MKFRERSIVFVIVLIVVFSASLSGKTDAWKLKIVKKSWPNLFDAAIEFIARIAPRNFQDDPTGTSFNKDDSNVPPLRRYKNVMPISYEIGIAPHIEAKEDKFDGDVNITIDLLNESNILTLHAKNLTINDIKLTSTHAPYVSYEPVEYLIDTAMDFLSIKFKHSIPRGIHVLSVKYTGMLNNEPTGFYRIAYQDGSNETLWMASTNFTTTGARLVFPCWDDFEHKATFSIAIKHNKNYTAFSHMPMLGYNTNNSTTTMTTRFAATPKISISNVTFIVANFDCLTIPNDVPLRFCGKKDADNKYNNNNINKEYYMNLARSILLENGVKNYRDTPYDINEFKKLDIIVWPNEGISTRMENQGIIVIGEPKIRHSKKSLGILPLFNAKGFKNINDTTKKVEEIFEITIKMANATSQVFAFVEKFTNALVKVTKVLGNFNLGLKLIGNVMDIINIFTSNQAESINSIVKRQHEEVMNAIQNMSIQITRLSSQLQQGINTISTSVEKIQAYYLWAHDIDDCVRYIDSLFMELEEKREYFRERKLNQYTMADFETKIFQTDSVETKLRLIYLNIVRPSVTFRKTFGEIFHAYIEQKSNRMCNEPSPNQLLYLIFSSIIIIEMKGYVILYYGYLIRSILHSDVSYKSEIEFITQAPVLRINDYINEFSQIMPSLSREIRNCDHQESPVPNVTYVELEKYIQFDVLDVRSYDSKCVDECTPNYEREDVKKFNSWFLFCKNATSKRRYEWLEVVGEVLYGKKNSCRHEEKRMAYHIRSEAHWTGFMEWTNVRLCHLCEITDIGIHSINTHAQLSTIESNMIITGIKFVRVKGMLAIQIKQGKLQEDGAVSDEVWENLQTGKENGEFSGKVRRMYLDNVILDSGYIVTGLNLSQTKNNDGFKLIVHGTRYDGHTGKLIANGSKWFDPEENSMLSLDYKHPRQLIDVKGFKTPLDFTMFEPDLNTNKAVRFERTTLEEDIGQSTIPFFDAQPVQVKEAIPLNGLGVYYKKPMTEEKYSGYIALRLFNEPAEKFLAAVDEKAPKVIKA